MPDIVIYPADEKAMEFDYTNYKGEKSHRRAVVQLIQFSSSKWHPEPQWLCKAWDTEKLEFREFAMRDMVNVRRYG